MATKKKSPIWAYFNEDENPRIVICTLCNAKISRGGIGKQATTSGMVNHLKYKHIEEFQQINHALPKGQNTSTIKKKQLSLQECTENLKCWDINDPKAKQFHYLIAETLAVDNEAINMVNRPGFTRLMKVAVPRYKIPCRSYFSQTIIPEIYDKVTAKLKKMLSDTDAISFTSDMWTCMNNQASFLSFTAHWIDSNFNRKHAVLNIKHFEGQHTGQNIARTLQEIPNLWDIESRKIHAIVHDNGRNMVKAVNDAKMQSVCCFIHTLQLIVNDSLKVQPEVIAMISGGKRIVTHFNHSGIAQEYLRKIQEDLHLPEHKLVQDVSTRWNSTYYMLERLLEQKRAISLYLTDCDCNISNLSAAQWELLEQLLKLLEPFEELTKIVSSELSCISETIPHVVILKKYCNKDSTSDLTSRISRLCNVRVALQRGLNQRFANLMDDKKFMLATLLDPRFKINFFTEHLQVEKARQYLLLESLITLYEESSDESTHSSPGKSKKRRTEESQSTHSSFWDCYDEVVAEQHSEDVTSSENSMSAMELDMYLKIKCISRQSNPYTWWAENKKKFPRCLSKLAAKYLSTPASSVYSERLFSEAGNVYEEKRAKLLPTNAEKLVFLHHNLPILNFNYDEDN